MVEKLCKDLKYIPKRKAKNQAEIPSLDGQQVTKVNESTV